MGRSYNDNKNHGQDKCYQPNLKAEAEAEADSTYQDLAYSGYIKNSYTQHPLLKKSLYLSTYLQLDPANLNSVFFNFLLF